MPMNDLTLPGAGPDSSAGLDADQRKAVLHGSGPLLLVAGAGSGKTRAIVARIVHLVQSGAPPQRIVGITFTNRAAEEMRDRVIRELSGQSLPGGPEPAFPWLGTFHAFGASLLRRFGNRIGLSQGFLIYDDRDRLDVIRQVLRDLDIDGTRFPPARFAAVIERAKRDGGSIEQATHASGWLFAGKAEAVAKAYGEALAAAGAVDFADLIRLPVRLLRTVPEALDAVRAEIRHLLVDEFQDVDGGQADMTRLIAAGAESFLAVGDEDQSIYGWRGGSAAPMLSFERDHPGAAVLHLGTNYRSRAAVLAAAGVLIRKNRLRREKPIVAVRGGGDPPVVRVYEDADDEAAGVAAAVARELSLGTRRPETAILYRVNAQSRAIEDALRRLGIPYVLRGALSFYDRASVRDAVAYLRWFVHPDDPVSLKRLLRAPRRGVGEATLARAWEAARRSGRPYAEALAGLPGLAPLIALRRRWIEGLAGRSVGEALHDLLEGAGYHAWLARETPEGDQKGRSDDRENVQELLRLAASVPSRGEEGVRVFLERMSLSPRDADADADAGGAVRLMTFHNAKGLEFDAVFLVGLEEGLLPHVRSSESDAGVEEERRLFYVGLTRARDRAFLSLARRRALFGSFHGTVPSRFLSDIPASLLHWEDGPARTGGDGTPPRIGVSIRGSAPPGSCGRPGSVRSRFGIAAPPNRPDTGGPTVSGRGPASGGASRVRRRVRHPVFGEGWVERVEGTGADEKIIVRFPGYGLKKILVRAVRMEFFD
jgi:DNA helicase II / ATP-dependent DNA helicase PcrA